LIPHSSSPFASRSPREAGEMVFQRRAVLTLAAIIVLNLGIRAAYGFYSHTAFLSAVLVLALSLAACLLTDRQIVCKRAAVEGMICDGDTVALACAALLLGAINVASTEISYADVTWARQLLISLAITGYVVTVYAMLSRPGVLNQKLEPAGLKR